MEALTDELERMRGDAGPVRMETEEIRQEVTVAYTHTHTHARTHSHTYARARARAHTQARVSVLFVASAGARVAIDLSEHFCTGYALSCMCLGRWYVCERKSSNGLRRRRTWSEH